MTTIELKNRLKEKIESIEQNELLEQLIGIIELESMNSEVFKISEEQRKGIEIGLQQIKRERLSPIMKLWLSINHGAKDSVVGQS